MLEGLTIAQAGPWVAFVTVCLGVVTAVYTGKLIPASWVDRMEKARDNLDAAKDARIAEQGSYIEVLKENNSLYQVLGRETGRVVSALPGPAPVPADTEGR